MPNICDYCEEMKPCRKKMYPLSFMGKHSCFWYGFYSSFNWICEKCDKAKKIIWNNELKKNAEKQIKEQQSWIKHRDKILKGSQE